MGQNAALLNVTADCTCNDQCYLNAERNNVNISCVQVQNFSF
jgi:hypothetical protein